MVVIDNKDEIGSLFNLHSLRSCSVLPTGHENGHPFYFSLVIPLPTLRVGNTGEGLFLHRGHALPMPFNVKTIDAIGCHGVKPVAMWFIRVSITGRAYFVVGKERKDQLGVSGVHNMMDHKLMSNRDGFDRKIFH